jgi:hypothetical protein
MCVSDISAPNDVCAIGYLTGVLYFQVFLFLAMATCFGISIPSSGQFYECLPTIREPNN